MFIEKLFTMLSTLAKRRLSRMPTKFIVAMFLLVASLLVWIAYQLTTLLVLQPIASICFKYSGRVASHDVFRPASAPKVASTFTIGASPINRTEEIINRHQHINYEVLPMRRPEVDLLLSYLKPTDTYLEFGASATTLSFPFLVHQAYSIEHDTHVCKLISDELQRDKNLSKKLRAFCAIRPAEDSPKWGRTSQFEEGSYRLFEDYVDFPIANLSHVRFDHVLINGRARVACALRILPLLKPTSLLFFHDFFRRPAHYAEVLPFYDEVARVVAHMPPTGYSDEPMGLLVLRPKPQFIGTDAIQPPPSHMDVVYERYDEQAPTAETSGFQVAVEHMLLNSDEGGFPYYEMSRKMSIQTSLLRLLLDVIALPFVLFTYWGLKILFVYVFVDAMASSSAVAASSNGAGNSGPIPPRSVRRDSRDASSGLAKLKTSVALPMVKQMTGAIPSVAKEK